MTDLTRTAIRDVTLRDGLQLTGKPLPTARKVQLVHELFELGVEDIEVGSMARPDLVPAVADTLDVVAALSPAERERLWAQMVGIFPLYDEYAQKTDREIPIVLLTPQPV